MSLKTTITFFILFTFSMLWGQTIENNTVNWKSEIGENYTISYPETWRLDKSGLMGSKFFLYSPLIDDKDKFSENVNLMTQDLQGLNLTLEQIASEADEQIKNFLTDGKLIESKTLTNDNLKYHKLIFTGKQGIYTLKFEQYFILFAEKAFILTFTAEESVFAAYAPFGEKILNSFKLK